MLTQLIKSDIYYDKEKLEEFLRHFELSFIILHGSYVTGKERRDSDIDLALVKKKNSTKHDWFAAIDVLSEIFSNLENRDLDVKFMDKADPLFRNEVASAGLLLAGNPAEFEEYKAVSLRMFEDARGLFELESLLAKKTQDYLNQIVAHA